MTTPPITNSSIEQLRETRLQKAQTLVQQGIDPYPYSFDRTHTALTLQDLYKSLADDEVTEDVVRVAGRIMAIRNSGMFMVLDDGSERIQIFSNDTTLSQQYMALLDYLDVGDWLGVEGIVRRTKRGELTINAQTLTLLTKSLRPLPEKYHGLTDIETRYRQRYLDLIMNQETRITLRRRSQLISKMRNFLVDRGFLEVETPMLHLMAGGAAAMPFETHHNALNLDMVLRIAPELHLKRLIVGGLSDKVFEINRCFRNEGISPKHNPEFTTIELYQAFADYKDMMALTEELVSYLALEITGSTEITYQGKSFSLKAPWARKSMIQLVLEKTGVDFLACATAEEAAKMAQTLGMEMAPKTSWGKIVETVFAATVEDDLGGPIHVTDMPRDISPLAKGHREDPRLTERFETYINGWEIANAFSEITDPVDQYQRFSQQLKEKEAGDEEAHPMDLDFIHALEFGMPPTGGLGIGIDRLTMLLTDSASIRDVIAFPTMKPLRGE